MNNPLFSQLHSAGRYALVPLFALLLHVCCFSGSTAFAADAAFEPADVTAKARSLAQSAFKPGEKNVDDALLRLSAEQWATIRFKREQALWRKEGLPFTLEFFQPGFIYNRTVGIHIVENGQSGTLSLNREMFDFGNLQSGGKPVPASSQAAGFRVLYPMRSPDHPDELASFLGATFFRALGKHATYGIYARGLALNTASPDGEEFPYFRDFWLIKPDPEAEFMTIYALMDSPSMTGAFRFDIRPGTSTIMDVDCTLFLRKGVREPQKIGLAPLSSMFFHSETTNCRTSDYRPEVHNSDGLLYAMGTDTWHWRPLANPERLGVNSFFLHNPRGFGLMQRDNNFDHYQDIASRFELRSSLWVEPVGDWGSGRLELVEIPTKDDIHDNIAAFWVPDPPAENTADKPAESEEPVPLHLAYRLYWMSSGVSPHSLGRVVATRLVRPAEGDNTVRFLVDFESEPLKALSTDTGLTSVLELPQQVQLLDKQLTKNPVTGGWRLSFRVRLPQKEGVMQIIPSRDGAAYLRFRALLKRGENLPDPLTEVWVYDLPS